MRSVPTIDRKSKIIDEVVDLGMRSKVRVEHELHFEDQWNDAFLLKSDYPPSSAR